MDFAHNKIWVQDKTKNNANFVVFVYFDQPWYDQFNDTYRTDLVFKESRNCCFVKSVFGINDPLLPYCFGRIILSEHFTEEKVQGYEDTGTRESTRKAIRQLAAKIQTLQTSLKQKDTELEESNRALVAMAEHRNGVTFLLIFIIFLVWIYKMDNKNV